MLDNKTLHRSVSCNAVAQRALFHAMQRLVIEHELSSKRCATALLQSAFEFI
jgi:hypothetical protein